MYFGLVPEMISDTILVVEFWKGYILPIQLSLRIVNSCPSFLSDAVRRGYDEVAAAYTAARSTEGPRLDICAQCLDSVGESAQVLDAG
ncbi:hypothetical protein SAMN05444271_13716 [Halohasta litchfieldiae]|uniref:Uncharacterized protein n=1 Tax=Halohasta litchfieldiae TaxID=1073996 RepID=A0A1H6XFW1_9EURY|nr:hypothetical protein SAMN05444271_13716 [Halohasta litchfieldiae]